jgi:hypothetical protein
VTPPPRECSHLQPAPVMTETETAGKRSLTGGLLKSVKILLEFKT